MSLFGTRVARVEDERFLTGAGGYGDDLPLAGALHATFVRSQLPHARIVAVDTSGVAEVEGAQAFTAADLDLGVLPLPSPSMNRHMGRPILASEVVRHAGEAIAVVVCEDPQRLEDAVERVEVELDELPAVADAEAALAGDPLLFPAAGTNVCGELPAAPPDAHLFDSCEVVVSTTFRSQRQASCPIECRTAAAVWADDRLTAWVSTQTPNGARDALAAALGLDPEQVRLLLPDVGGGFGPKIGAGVEAVIVAALARKLGRPVRWAETRSENMLALGHGRAQIQRLTLGGSRAGDVEAYRLEILQDAGSYPAEGATLPELTALCASGTYAIPRIETSGRFVVTNTTPTVAYRGAGRPEAIQGIERAMDLFAAELGLDPAEVRRRNLIAPGAFPYTTAAGATYDSGEYERALDLALETAGYADLRAEQRRRREAGDPRQLGIGVALYMEIANPTGEAEWGAVELTPDGGARVRSGLGPTGQGHHTALKMLVADRLGLPFEAITVITGDTDLVPRGVGTYGSRSLQVGGTAVDGAATRLVERARELAAERLEAAAADVELDPGRGAFRVVGVPGAAVSWAELAEGLADRDRLGELAIEEDFDPPGPTWPFGAHVAVVEVDTETGKVALQRLIAVDDCGPVLNPVLAEGQRHGGIAQGAAQALLEEMAYDEDANPQTDTFVTYPVISATDLPMFELATTETPTHVNALGAKGIGESATIGSTPAVHGAVLDALAPLGVRDLDMPAAPQRVWRAIADAAGAAALSRG
jgi:aerobic carbon-monoxide dehydrogenase large subunit